MSDANEQLKVRSAQLADVLTNIDAQALKVLGEQLLSAGFARFQS